MNPCYHSSNHIIRSYSFESVKYTKIASIRGRRTFGRQTLGRGQLGAEDFWALEDIWAQTFGRRRTIGRRGHLGAEGQLGAEKRTIGRRSEILKNIKNYNRKLFLNYCSLGYYYCWNFTTISTCSVVFQQRILIFNVFSLTSKRSNMPSWWLYLYIK